ncbi:MAG: translation initiation factor IF-2 N-terminal domain-containing protein, partial [Planctomycetales bacterium]|nr:translation initiation factor IF-2 N-terminal domain-containing protein [Planctomycetales bacterium]
MPLRIYALAKELNVDSKELVDICAKAGVTGKGSALASLTDDEAEKVKAYLSGGATARSKPAAKPVANKPMVSTGPLSKLSQPRTAGATPAAQAGGALTRESAYSGRGGSKEIKVLTPKSKREDGDRSSTPDKKKSADDDVSRIKLAPVPAANQPAPPPKKSAAETAQKPTIRLPKDAIQKARQGSTGRLDEIREQAEKKRKKDDGETPRKTQEVSAKGRRDRGKKGPMEGGEDGTGRGLSDLASHRRARQDKRKTRPGVLGSDDDTSEFRRRRGGRREKIRAKDTAAPRKERVVVT